jgi:thioredoxin-related protein
VDPMLVHRFVSVCIASVILGLGALAGFARAEDSLWQTDFEAAKTKAKAEKKLLLVDFTGSDWCGWCKKLVAEVFSKEEFKKEAPKKFVLVELDFPQSKKQSDELKKQNKKLLEQYKVQGYPTILVLDAEGQVVAKTGYQAGGAEKYVKHLADFVDVYGTVVTIKKELEAAKGIDRAKLLDKLVDAYIKLNNEIDELAAWDKEIVALDVDNKAGLKAKHEFRVLMAEFAKLKEARKYDELKAVAEKALALSGVTEEQKLDVYLALCQANREGGQFDQAKAVAEKALALPGITAEQKQSVYLLLCQTYAAQSDFVNVVACLKKGIEVAPDSEQSKQFKMFIQQCKPMADAQEAIVKLKAELENVKGLDRAKILDKLVEAQSKLAAAARGTSSQDIEKWSREIITLDADNKAGLKNKYEFRLMLGDAGKLFQQGKSAEGHALIEKALAISGLTGEQKQQAHFIAAVSRLNEKDYQKGIDGLKEALKAAPDSQQAAFIKRLIGMAEEKLKPEKGDKGGKE